MKSLLRQKLLTNLLIVCRKRHRQIGEQMSRFILWAIIVFGVISIFAEPISAMLTSVM